MSTDQLFTITHAAEYLTVQPATVRKWVQLGRLEYIKLGGSIRLRKRVLDELIEASTRKVTR